MPFLSKFIKLMKGEPVQPAKDSPVWTIDERKCLSESEVSKLRKAGSDFQKLGPQEQRYNQIRNWFMVELGLNAGLRVAEMASLKHQDLLIDSERSSIVVLGKGNKRRAVWISSGFKSRCKKFRWLKNQFGYSTNPESHLLNNLKGTKISKRALQKAFKNILARAGLPGHYSIHCLRHTYTTFLLKACNYNYRFVQQQLGHASIRTTQVYASVLESEGRKALERIYR